MHICLMSILDTRLLDLFSHFMKHYYELGVDEIRIAVHHRIFDEKKQKQAEEIINQYNIRSFVKILIIPELKDSNNLCKVSNRCWREFSTTLPEGSWKLIADTDEFVVFDKPLHKLATDLEYKGFNAIQGKFVDRVSPKGFIPVEQNTDIFKQFPNNVDITGSVMGATLNKICLMKSNVDMPWGGHHEIYNPRFGPGLHPVYHFKWIENIKDRLKIRYNDYYNVKAIKTEISKLLMFIESKQKFPESQFSFSFDIQKEREVSKIEIISKPKRLIYTVAIDTKKQKTSELAKMCVKSIRHFGYDDDIVVLANNWQHKNTNCIVLYAHKASKAIIYTIRTTIQERIGLSKYSQILYMDCDTLATQNPNKLFDDFNDGAIHIQSENTKLMNNYNLYQTLCLTPDEFLQNQEESSLCSGIILIPGSIAINFLKSWHDATVPYSQCDIISDQSTLQAMKLRKTFNIKLFPINVGRGEYFTHYCWLLGYKKFHNKLQAMSEVTNKYE